MAVRIVSYIDAVYNDPNNSSLIGVQVYCVVLGDNFGDLSNPRYHYTVYGLDPSNMSLEVDIQAAIKADALTHGVPFGIMNTDSVQLLP